MARLLIAAWIPILLFPLGPLHADIIHVPGDQPTIQAGIDAAADGDTVLVGPGTYYDPIDFKGKTIVVRSARGPESTILDGSNYAERIVTISSGSEIGTVFEGFTVTGSEAGGIECSDSSPSITGNIIQNNGAGGWYDYGYTYFPGSGPGGGIYANGAASISNNYIMWNATGSRGGGIWAGSQVTVIGNWLEFNDAINPFYNTSGGGIWAEPETTIIGNMIISNRAGSSYSSVEAENFGGGISGGGLIKGNFIQNNGALTAGDGIFTCSGIIQNNIIVDDIECHDIPNEPLEPGDLLLEGNILANCYSTFAERIDIRNCIVTGELSISEMGLLHLTYTDVVGGEAVVTSVPPATYTWGPGMISADPLFVSGPLGEFYLSQVAAGQDVDSPCIDAGDPATEVPLGVTRTDGVPDSDVIDIGHHYPVLGIVAGPGPSDINPPRVRLYSLGTPPQPIREFAAYGASGYGVNVTLGDLDGDLALEIITGPGPGQIYGPHVRGFETDGTPISDLSFLAYGTNKFGVNVAAGDLNGNGRDEIITGAGPGAVFGPHVRAFEYTPGSGVSAMSGVSFFAYNTLKWGVNVAAGDVDGDGFDEIITGAGPGTAFGPHVRGWNVDGGMAAVIPNMGFMSYAVNKYGVNVCCADVNGDGVDEIVTGPGPTGYFASHIRGWRWDGTETTPLSGYSFFAFPPEEALFGARVGRGADMDFDGVDELIVGGGPDPDLGTPVKVFRYADGEISEWLSFEAFPAGWTHGANAAGGWLR